MMTAESTIAPKPAPVRLSADEELLGKARRGDADLDADDYEDLTRLFARGIGLDGSLPKALEHPHTGPARKAINTWRWEREKRDRTGAPITEPEQLRESERTIALRAVEDAALTLCRKEHTGQLRAIREEREAFVEQVVSFRKSVTQTRDEMQGHVEYLRAHVRSEIEAVRREAANLIAALRAELKR